MIPSRVSTTPPAMSAAASSRPPSAGPGLRCPRWAPRPPARPEGGARRHRGGADEHAQVRARTQRHHQQGGTGDRGDRDRDECGAPARQRGLGRGRSAEQVDCAGQRRDDPGGDAERGLADVKGLQQRPTGRRGRADREPADRPAGGGHADDVPRRPPGARDRERRPGRVQRQHQHRGPQPARRPVVAVRSSVASLASTIGIVRSSPASACCWSSIRVSPSRNQAPSTRSGRGPPARPRRRIAPPSPARRRRSRVRRVAPAGRPARAPPGRPATIRSAPR